MIDTREYIDEEEFNRRVDELALLYETDGYSQTEAKIMAKSDIMEEFKTQ